MFDDDNICKGYQVMNNSCSLGTRSYDYQDGIKSDQFIGLV